MNMLSMDVKLDHPISHLSPMTPETKVTKENNPFSKTSTNFQSGPGDVINMTRTHTPLGILSGT